MCGPCIHLSISHFCTRKLPGIGMARRLNLPGIGTARRLNLPGIRMARRFRRARAHLPLEKRHCARIFLWKTAQLLEVPFGTFPKLKIVKGKSPPWPPNPFGKTVFFSNVKFDKFPMGWCAQLHRPVAVIFMGKFQRRGFSECKKPKKMQ